MPYEGWCYLNRKRGGGSRHMSSYKSRTVRKGWWGCGGCVSPNKYGQQTKKCLTIHKLTCILYFSVYCRNSFQNKYMLYYIFNFVPIISLTETDLLGGRRFTKFSANYFYNSLFREFNHPSILSFNSKHSRHHFINEILNELNILMLMFDAPCNMINTILFQYRKSASNTYSYKLK